MMIRRFLKMSQAKITLIGLENYLNPDRSVFDRMQLPEGIDKETLVGSILMRCQEFELLYTDPEQALKNDLASLAEQAAGFRPVSRFVPFCVEGEFYGVHFVDKIFGADVFFQDGQWYNRPLKTEVGELKEPDLENSETWLMAKAYAQAFLDCRKDGIEIAEIHDTRQTEQPLAGDLGESGGADEQRHRGE